MCVVALGILGTVLSVGGAIMQGQQEAAMAEAQAKAYEQQGRNDAIASAYEARQERRKQDLAMSAAIAQTGASGVALKGSPTAVLAANAQQGEMELQAIRFGSQLRQNNLNDQAAISRWSGRQARGASFIKAGSSLISGADKAVRLVNNPFV